MRRPQFTASCYRFFAFFFEDFALRFLAICFSLPVKDKDLSRTFGEREMHRREGNLTD
ncbi:MAG: hypothetical protein ACRES8_07055 [Nevskiaceae bacterium]